MLNRKVIKFEIIWNNKFQIAKNQWNLQGSKSNRKMFEYNNQKMKLKKRNLKEIIKKK